MCIYMVRLCSCGVKGLPRIYGLGFEIMYWCFDVAVTYSILHAISEGHEEKEPKSYTDEFPWVFERNKRARGRETALTQERRARGHKDQRHSAAALVCRAPGIAPFSASGGGRLGSE